MNEYIVSARKYRPSTFSSVVGQKALTATLRTAIATDRLAHAYLFCGSRGVGKTSCARIFAKTINCEHPTPQGDPCNECPSCREFNQGRSLNIIELDAASNNGVDDMRNLIDQVMVPPTNGRYRVFIIDEVHMLSSAAFNAFLKTLEEPPSYVVFVLATTEKHKIIPTILSRCQVYDFNRITVTDIVDHLEYVASQEGITAERAALRVIANKADGAMRDALSIFDQVAASTRGNITYQAALDNLNMLDTAVYSRLVDAFINSDVPTALLIYKDVRDRGFDSQFFINGLGQHLRDLMVARDPATQVLLDYDREAIDLLVEQAKKCEPQFYYQAMNLCNSADLNYRTATNKTFLVELLLIRLCQLHGPSPSFSGVGEGQLDKIAATPQPVAPQPSRPAATPQPEPKAAPQPAVSTAPAPAPAPAPALSRASARPHHQRISLNPQSPTPASQQPVGTTSAWSHRTGAYTPQQVVAAWHSYEAKHPTEHILVNTMRMAEPVAVEGKPGRFRVTVPNAIQKDELGKHLYDLTAMVRNEVANDTIEFEIEISTEGDAAYAWNSREVYNHLLENPDFRDFAQRLNLTLL